MKTLRLPSFLAALCFLIQPSLFAQGTAFTYQGRLIDNGVRANGNYDLTFTLYDARTAGNQIGTALTNAAVVVSNGLFTTQLDFGAGVFTNASLWLEIGEGVSGSGTLTILSPRQALTASPYAIAAGTLTGTVSAAQLPASVLTNGASGITLNGIFSGDASGVTNIPITGLDSFGDLTIATNPPVPFILSATLPTDSSPVGVAFADINGDGKPDLISANYYGNDISLYTNNGDGTFTQAGTITVGSNPSWVAAADLTGNGRTDLIVANESDDTLTILLNNGDGTFSPAPNLNTGIEPFSVTVADVNGDNVPDLIVANYYFLDNTLSVFLGNGDGTFTEDAGSPYAVGSGPATAVATDVNGDNHVDLVSVNEYDATLTVLTNNGDGTFTFSATVPVGQDPYWLAAADVNGDSQPDLISANDFDNTLTVVTNDGTGNFVTASTVPAGNGPVSVLATNLFGAGLPDLVCVNSGTSPSSGSLMVFTNNGDGTFGVLPTVPTGTYPAAVAAADLTGDGKLALAVVNNGDNDMAIFTNNPGSSTYSLEFSGSGAGLTGLNVTNLVGTIPDALLSPDVPLLNNNGYLPNSDLSPQVPLLRKANTFTNAGNIFVGSFFGDGFGLTNLNLAAPLTAAGFVYSTNWGRFAPAASPSVGNGPNSLTSADVNGDGKMDLITANTYDDTLTILTNDGAGNFVMASSPGTGSGPSSVIAVDVNGDNYMDLIAANANDNTLTILTNDGTGNFVTAATPPVGSYPTGVIVADINGDHQPDLISVNNGDNTLTILTNDGTGNFVFAASPAVGSSPYAVTAADVNHDGFMDLITANVGDNTLTILTNDGTGNFVMAASPPVGQYPLSVTSANINGDGYPDLISANFSDGTLTILTNDGAGNFATASSPNVGLAPHDVIAADVNNDGKMDLIVSCLASNSLTLLLNNGDGNFTLSTLSVGDSPIAVTAADVNGDGQVDLISANTGANDLTVLLNGASSYNFQKITGDGSGFTNLNASQLSGPVPGTLVWQGASGTVIQAVANAGYFITNDTAQVTVTLPASPNPGDVVRVSGSGGAGWVIAQNGSQSILSSNLSGVSPTTTPGPAGYLSGGANTAIELQYMGNNVFMPISHEGTITAF